MNASGLSAIENTPARKLQRSKRLPLVEQNA